MKKQKYHAVSFEVFNNLACGEDGKLINKRYNFNWLTIAWFWIYNYETRKEFLSAIAEFKKTLEKGMMSGKIRITKYH